MSKPKSYHFIGIGGIGMSSLAHICLDLGASVSGSDLGSSPYIDALKKRGADISLKQDGKLISNNKHVVYSSAISDEHVELKTARDLHCQVQHRSELLRDVCQTKRPIVVAGTHGKTSSSALLAHVLEEGKKNPSYMVGGKVLGFDRYGKMGSGDCFVIEGDESDGTLEQYSADHALITNIELDHVDTYASIDEVFNVFKTFISKSNEENLVWCFDDANIRSLNLKGKSYGEHKDACYQMQNYSQDGWVSKFDIYADKKNIGEINIPVVGKHLAMNALGVYVIASSLGMDHESIASAMASFKGTKRRLEKIGAEHSITFIDDYAHHPTEVKATLEGLKEVDIERRLVALFQPHRYTRFESFYDPFLEAFSAADEVIVTDVYAAGERGSANINEFVKKLPVKSSYIPRDDLEKVRDILQPHDIVIALGAGDITSGIHDLYEQTKEQGIKKRWKVGVIYGGPSPEHYVSVASAKNILPHFDGKLYDIKEFHINPKGHWDDSLQERLGDKSMQKLLACDVVFPMLHGIWGEDGAAQGLFSSLHKPYVGCDYRASAICMDKIATKLIAEKWGVKIAPFYSIEERIWKRRSSDLIEEIESQFKYPLYVKPNHLGSSIGIHKVKNTQDLKAAIEEALSFDSHALIEEEIIGRQLEFALFGNSTVHCFPAGEIISDGDFVGYKGKYGAKALPLRGKANVSDTVMKEGVRLAKRVFRSLGIHGIARIDFFLTEKNEYILNEVNPLPGFTPTSMYPVICEENNFPLSKLLDHLLILAFDAHRGRLKKVSDIGDEGVIR